MPSNGDKHGQKGAVSGFAHHSNVAVPDMCTRAGAGKSSMLDCLCMRSTGGQVAGIIRVNGRSINKARFRSISTYVPQVRSLLAYVVRSNAAHVQLFNSHA